MSKQSGLGDRFLIDGHNLSGDINSPALAGGPAALVVTGVDKGAPERIGGVRDGSLGWTAFFNPGEEADAAHAVLSALPQADVHCMYLHTVTLGRPAACLVAKQIGYDGNRGDDGAFTFAVQAQANGYGLEWGVQLTPGMRTDTAATDGDSVDLTAAGAFGLQAYLQVLAVTGTSVTVKLQQSSDNGVADAWADVTGGAFAAATEPGVQRLQTARGQAVERYLRAVTTGTFTEAVFAVVVARNEVETEF
ncbi:hypothetical protein VSR01_10760 [Actinacidiphila sp. DG2A-62]|uniref:hypothetical protein n=1 Tax=Actinacidiphila sp. DG2A-62 TaxID=3108821 RepID=UPI002DBAB978|nr:hypothetical protein [Actinacidiphila sp. DG2A-62]MEC3993999.1 hypothetical protein [Actinacidiphila sp. DG2A-62]